MSGNIKDEGVDGATEAKDLVREAKEARAEGDKEEADFLIDAAKELDPKAAEEELKSKS